jgi:hypothetical protein
VRPDVRTWWSHASSLRSKSALFRHATPAIFTAARFRATIRAEAAMRFLLKGLAAQSTGTQFQTEDRNGVITCASVFLIFAFVKHTLHYIS